MEQTSAREELERGRRSYGDSAGSRLEALAPVGGVLIGAETYERLPEDTVVEPRAGLQVKGKDDAVDAYVLLACPSC
jgi:class 3 adenylate cyclase